MLAWTIKDIWRRKIWGYIFSFNYNNTIQWGCFLWQTWIIYLRALALQVQREHGLNLPAFSLFQKRLTHCYLENEEEISNHHSIIRHITYFANIFGIWSLDIILTILNNKRFTGRIFSNFCMLWNSTGRSRSFNLFATAWQGSLPFWHFNWQVLQIYEFPWNYYNQIKIWCFWFKLVFIIADLLQRHLWQANYTWNDSSLVRS